MTDPERHEIAKKYQREKVRSMQAIRRQEFDSKSLAKRFRLERMIIDEFISMYGEPDRDARAD